MPNCIDLFRMPLSTQAIQQFQELNAALHQIPTTALDIWYYPWKKGKFSSMQLYKWIHNIWKCATMLRCKIFFWLLLYVRVSSRNLLQRKIIFLQVLGLFFCSPSNSNTEETDLLCSGTFFFSRMLELHYSH